METIQPTATVVAATQGRKLNVLGHSITIKLARTETLGHHYVFECVTPPGLGIPPHVHDREDEIIYVAEGEYRIMLGDKMYDAKAGDYMYFPRHIPHGFQNVGSRAGKTLWTVVPGGNFESFFEELAALPAGEPDMGKVVAIFAAYGMKVLVGAVA